MHCQKELDRDLGYDALIPDETLFRWFEDRYSTSKHLLTLYAIARGMHARNILEIGFGRSSFVLARAAAENGGQLITCDCKDFSSLLSPEEQKVTQYIHGRSGDLWKELDVGIDFAFLDYFSDEALSQSFCTSEIRQCLRWVKTNGVIALHDVLVHKYSLRKAVARLSKRRDLEYSYLPYNYGLGLIAYRGTSKYGKVTDQFIKKSDPDSA
jgi:predicted O-methyltransferase YrrM